LLNITLQENKNNFILNFTSNLKLLFHARFKIFLLKKKKNYSLSRSDILEMDYVKYFRDFFSFVQFNLEKMDDLFPIVACPDILQGLKFSDLKIRFLSELFFSE